jgi:hypothetical protein
MWLAPPAHADEMWTVVAKDSHFGPGVNTLVIKHRVVSSVDLGEPTMPATDRRFLLISGGSIYLAVDEQSESPGGAFITGDSARWPHMKLIKIGERIFRDYCYRCFLYRDGLREDQITLKFSATTVDPRIAITNSVVTSAP